MPEHVSSTMYVFRDEKYRLLLRVAGPKGPQRKQSKILPNGIYDRNGSLTVRQMDDLRQTHSGKKNAGGVVNQAHTLFSTPRKKSIHGERDSRVGEDKEKINKNNDFF